MFCPFCGAQNADDTRVCVTCGSQITSKTPAASAEVALARLGDRFLAVILDTILFAAVFAISGMAVAKRYGGITDQGFSFEGTPALLSMGATALIAFFYYWLCEGLFGATLGKAMLGVSVKMRDGSACHLGPSLIRNVLRLIDAFAVYLVGFVIAILSKQRQRLGDHVAGTIVIESKIGPFARSALVILWLLLLGGGVGGAYLLHRGASTRGETSTGALRASNFGFVVNEGGPSRPAAPYKPSEKVRLEYDITGYSTDSEGRPKLKFQVTAMDPNGVPLNAPWEDEFTRRLERGSPVHGRFNIGVPGSVPAGTCKIVLTVRDLLNDAQLELTAPFQVEAEPLAPATSLEVRDLELAASESGASVPALQLQDGGTVYMRCRVFGMQFRDNAADVRMAIKLIGPGGDVVFEKPDYGSIHDTWVYHPATFHVPVTGHLSLPSGAPKGLYKVTYTFTDTIAGSNVSSEKQFELK